VSWLAWVIGPGWIGGGLVLYILYSRRRALPIREEVFALESAPAPANGRFRILVPVADPDQVFPLIPPMVRIAEATAGVVELVHLVAVPDQVPLSDAASYALAGREAAVEAGLYLPSDRIANSSVLYCRNPARGILFQARAGSANLILLGWRGRPSGSEYIFGTTVDQVLEKSTFDVAVFKPNGKVPFRRVLVPVAGGPNSLRALEIAGMLAPILPGGSSPPCTCAPRGPNPLISMRSSPMRARDSPCPASDTHHGSSHPRIRAGRS
jgi:APA family basic amino acid/polyamine antiporter